MVLLIKQWQNLPLQVFCLLGVALEPTSETYEHPSPHPNHLGKFLLSGAAGSGSGARG
jgi:hypothetical protein